MCRNIYHYRNLSKIVDQSHDTSEYHNLDGLGTHGLVNSGNAHVSQFGVWFKKKQTKKERLLLLKLKT